MKVPDGRVAESSAKGCETGCGIAHLEDVEETVAWLPDIPPSVYRPDFVGTVHLPFVSADKWERAGVGVIAHCSLLD